jgi:hypothetical protein
VGLITVKATADSADEVPDGYCGIGGTGVAWRGRPDVRRSLVRTFADQACRFSVADMDFFVMACFPASQATVPSWLSSPFVRSG